MLKPRLVRLNHHTIRVSLLMGAMLLLAQVAYASDGAISICDTPANLFVARVDLNAIGVTSGVYADPSKKKTVSAYFSTLLASTPKGALAVNANFYVNDNKSVDWPYSTPIGRVMTSGELVVFPKKSGSTSKKRYPAHINGQKIATADTLAIYKDSSGNTHAGIIDYGSWWQWQKTHGGTVQTAIAGLAILEKGQAQYTKAKAAEIAFAKSRQRTAIGFSSQHDGVLYIMVKKVKSSNGAKISDLPGIFQSIPADYCGDSKDIVVDSILNLDGGGSSQIQVQATGTTAHSGVFQERTLPAILYFLQN